MRQTMRKYWFPIAMSLGIGLGLLTSEVYNSSMRYYYETRDITDFFETEVYVPNFDLGEDPNVVYTKFIHEEFIGDFSVEIRRVSDDKEMCQYGDTAVPYTVDKNETVITRPLSWYLGSHRTGVSPDCFRFLPYGEYYLITTYVLRQDGRPERTISYPSNIFTVGGKNVGRT